jgi:two-component system, NtrC family, response regulator AtoC
VNFVCFVVIFYMVRILVIDDDRHMRTACSRVLSNAGWEVVCAENGTQALGILESGSNRIDIVLLDQLMPGMSGMEVLARIQEITPGLPVVIMTGSVTDDDARDIKLQGARDCLGKPFTPEQLRSVVKEVIGETTGPGANSA